VSNLANLQCVSKAVVCNNEISGFRDITIGVPQGSVLGPVLFMIYVNDLSNNVHLGSCNMYADDTIVYTSGNTIEEVNEKLQLSINDVSKWYTENHLVVNEGKCSYPTNSLNIRMGDYTLLQVHINTYLGVNIDDGIRWYPQIDKICKQLGFKMAQLKIMKTFCNINMLNEIYMTTIQPIIDYGITVWSTVPKYCIKRIQKLQNFCARIINNNFDFINTRGLDLVKQIGWMNIVERIDYFTNLLIYKCINQIAPVYLQNDIILCSEIKKRN
jgi:hypothetical protein